MALRYADTPQLICGRQPSASDNWRQRFPASAQSIASAPTNTSTPIWIYEPSGDAHLCIYHRGAWQKLSQEFDDRDGAVRIAMMGEGSVANAVAWAPQGKPKR